MRALSHTLAIEHTQDLDQALLRPGRFEQVYEIPSPGPVARMEILKYHSRNKPIEAESVLSRVAEVTQVCVQGVGGRITFSVTHGAKCCDLSCDAVAHPSVSYTRQLPTHPNTRPKSTASAEPKKDNTLFSLPSAS